MTAPSKKSDNFSNKENPDLGTEKEFKGNFAMSTAKEVDGKKVGHPIPAAGDGTDYKFLGNMLNRQPPEKAIVPRRCNIMDKYLEVGAEDISIGGVKIGTVKSYVHRHYGYYDENKKIVYFPEPKDTPCEAPD